MKKLIPYALAWISLAITLLDAAGKSSEVATLPDGLSGLAGKRVLWLGDSITYAGGYVADVNYYLVTRMPSGRFDFINAGLSSETVSGLSEPNHAGGKFPRPYLHERLDRVLTQTHPEVVFACYGMNCGIYLPFDEERFGKYKEGTNLLHQKAVGQGIRIIHLTPPVYDARGENEAYARTLDKYSEWLISQRKTADWEVIDLHFPIKKFIEEHRKNDPKFILQPDHVHPGALGHWVMAKAILQGLGAKDLNAVEDPQALTAGQPTGEKLLQRVTERMELLRNAWLTATRHLRPGVPKGLPLDQAKDRAAELEKQIDLLNSNPANSPSD